MPVCCSYHIQSLGVVWHHPQLFALKHSCKRWWSRGKRNRLKKSTKPHLPSLCHFLENHYLREHSGAFGMHEWHSFLPVRFLLRVPVLLHKMAEVCAAAADDEMLELRIQHSILPQTDKPYRTGSLLISASMWLQHFIYNLQIEHKTKGRLVTS